MKVITIGRHANNDFVINDIKVSRNHVQIVQDDNKNFTLVDLSSTNGTFVNGQKIIGEVRLNPSDIVKIGDSTLPWQVYFPPTQSSEPAQPEPEVISTSKCKIWIMVAVVVAVLILICGVFVIFNKDRKSESTVEMPQTTSSENDTEFLKSTADAAEAQSEYDKIKKEEAETKAQALEKEKIAANAEKQAALVTKIKAEEKVAEKQKELKKVEAEKEEAKKNDTEKQKELTKAKAEIEEATKKQKELERELEKKNQENEKLKREKDAKSKAKLSEQFNLLIEKADMAILNDVCTHFNYSTHGTTAKKILTQHFIDENTDNNRRLEIISEINTQKAKKQQSQ
ncbi:hypothetical protein FACS189437_02580 [Bacteroidia bacterium]|nr:hypothetical protein FACS189437_02580 [Bacteroidia bacterium]